MRPDDEIIELVEWLFEELPSLDPTLVLLLTMMDQEAALNLVKRAVERPREGIQVVDQARAAVVRELREACGIQGGVPGGDGRLPGQKESQAWESLGTLARQSYE